MKFISAVTKKANRVKESNIVYEKSDYWALQTPKGYFEVYQVGITHSTRCAQIGYAGEEGLARVKAEIDRRISSDRRKLVLTPLLRK